MPKNTPVFLAAIFWLLAFNVNIGQFSDVTQSKTSLQKGADGKLQADPAIFGQHLSALKKYASAHGFSSQYAFLIDMAMHSGVKRFFVVEIKTDKILAAGLVTHGSSRWQMKRGERSYSNEKGSFCTSLGKYKIGGKYYGKFGPAYKLTGLDATNSNAYARSVVLHSHPYVPDVEKETAICQSWGCPTVSPNFLKVLAGYIDVSDKPILLDIFDSGNN